MAVYLTVPLKKTSEVDLVKPLKNVISSYYSTADEPVNCTDALTELNKLRMNSTWRTLDKHESSLTVMYSYYDQLTILESKCPPQDIQVPFKWKDAFDKGSLFGGSSSLTLSSILYEKVCILFNIAAMQTQIAASQGTNVSDDDALKLAAKYFQQASGIFQHLKNTVMSSVQRDPTPDLHPDTLGALQSLMLAQAQETFFHKVTTDNMKEKVIAKVASQCEELYADAMKHMQKDSLRVLWERDWISTVASKQAAFHALSEYYQALVCKANKEVGEEIARLQHAMELMKAAETRGGISFHFKDYNGRIAREYEEAKKDNDFIYHARIPDVRSLPPVGKAAIAKPSPLPDMFNPSGTDLFSDLLPVPVQQAVQAFDVRKTEIINTEIGKLREHTQLMNGVLASLNLPAALEDSTGEALPQSIKDKAQAVRDKGGMQTIQKLIEDLPELLQRNKEILDESERVLNEEEESDKQLRAQFKERWTRTPSENLNEPLRSSAAKYRQIINNAIGADGVVKEKYNKHTRCIELFSKSEVELAAAIPSGSPTSSFSNTPVVQRLRRLMEEIEGMKAEREVIESELKSATVDMKSKFLEALSADNSVNEQALSVEKLGEVFGPLQKQVRESLAKQEKIIAEVQSANQEFCREKSSNQGASQRDTMLSDLASAHDAYMELTANLEEGRKFYNDLTELLLNFQNKISDFNFARKTEKDELCRDLQRNIVNQPVQPVPSLPAHHEPTGSQRPPRPPPPVTAPPPSTTTGPSYPYPATQPTMPQAPPPYPVYTPYPPQPYVYPPAPMPSGYNPYATPQQGGYPPVPGYPQYVPGSYPYPQQQWK